MEAFWLKSNSANNALNWWSVKYLFTSWPNSLRTIELTASLVWSIESDWSSLKLNSCLTSLRSLSIRKVAFFSPSSCSSNDASLFTNKLNSARSIFPLLFTSISLKRTLNFLSVNYRSRSPLNLAIIYLTAGLACSKLISSSKLNLPQTSFSSDLSCMLRSPIKVTLFFADVSSVIILRTISRKSLRFIF